jgi:hypothetical protein
VLGVYLRIKASYFVIFHSANCAKILHESDHGRVAYGIKVVFGLILSVLHHHRERVETMQWVSSHVAFDHIFIVGQESQFVI